MTQLRAFSNLQQQKAPGSKIDLDFHDQKDKNTLVKDKVSKIG